MEDKFKYFPERKMKLPIGKSRGVFLPSSEMTLPAGIYKYPYTDLQPWNRCKNIEDFRKIMGDNSYYINPETLIIEKK